LNTSILVIIASVSLALAASSAEIVHLGQPCQARNVLAGRVVVGRATGREMFVLSNMNENSGAELIFIDPEKNTGTVYRAPAGAGSWALDEVPGDRLVVGTFYDGVFMVFDLRKMEFTKIAAFSGESYIWNLAFGSDGRVYGGTYGGGKLGALDLETYAVEDLGAPAPPNMYLRYVSALPDGRILCSFGQEKNTVLIFDPATKEFRPLPKSMVGISAGVTWHGYFLAGGRAFKGKTLYEVPPPFPNPPGGKSPAAVDAYVTTDDLLVLNQGTAVYAYRSGDKDLKLIADINLRGRILASNRKGELLGVRGQDYFVIKPGDTKLHLKRIPGESAPRQTHFLRTDDRGRLWGGPTFGQTLWFMDTATKKATNTSTICDAGGEVYDVAFHDGKTYAIAYAGGDIVRYDADEPWNQWDNKNPKVIASVGAKGYIRPTGGAVFGPDGTLYSGWMARYGTYGGAVAITDPESGETELIENPLGEQAISGVAVDSKCIYVGSSLGANGLPNKTGESARFGVIDLSTRKVAFEHTFEGASGVRVLACDEKVGRVVVSVDGALKIFDSAKGEFIGGMPADLPAPTCNSVASFGGSLYYASEKSIVRLDIGALTLEKLAEAPAKVENVALGPDRTVYFSSDIDVYAVKADRAL